MNALASLRSEVTAINRITAGMDLAMAALRIQSESGRARSRLFHQLGSMRMRRREIRQISHGELRTETWGYFEAHRKHAAEMRSAAEQNGWRLP